MKTEAFRYRCLREGTWQISGSECDCYLLEGEGEALLIDTGSYQEDIRAMARTLTALPVDRAVNTHSHFDHTGGNGFFPRVFATEGIAQSAKNTMGEQVPPGLLDYGFTLVKDGDIIPLAGRPLEVLVLDCHSRENLAVLDRSHRLLFVGDEIDAGQVLLLPGYAERRGQLHGKPAASVEAYRRVLRRLQGLRDSFDWICTGHNGSPLPPCYLDWFDELCGRILSGEEQGDPDCSGPTYPPGVSHYPYPEAGYRRASWKGATLVYCGGRLWDSDPPGIQPATPLHAISAYSIS